MPHRGSESKPSPVARRSRYPSRGPFSISFDRSTLPPRRPLASVPAFQESSNGRFDASMDANGRRKRLSRIRVSTGEKESWNLPRRRVRDLELFEGTELDGKNEFVIRESVGIFRSVQGVPDFFPPSVPACLCYHRDRTFEVDS